MTGTDAAIVAVDWGTSHLRVWPLSADGRVLATRHSDQGMRNTARGDFSPILDAHLDALEVPAGTPVIMCGMVGSRQGWQEAPYVDVPCVIDDIIRHAVRIPAEMRDIRILPGLASRNPLAPDVMRSEETQLLGLCEISGGATDALVAMPGSHAKWVRIDGRTVTGFFSALTGELFASLTADSVIKHAVAGASGKVDPHSPVFMQAVRESLAEPATVLARLFSARPRGLLFGASGDDGAAYVSGTVIGQDIAGAIARFGTGCRVVLVGSGHLGALYTSAMQIAGFSCNMVDGDDLALAGLHRAAQVLWPDLVDSVSIARKEHMR